MIREPYKMAFDIGTIKHLGIQMYSTLPPVIGELVANAWDADASVVTINIPNGPLTESSEITIQDDGIGMSDNNIRNAYLVVGRDKRKAEGDELTLLNHRKVMGRKGIGKFSAFGVAGEIEIESVKNGNVSRLKINYKELEDFADKRQIDIPSLDPTGSLVKGTRITLRYFNKYRKRHIPIQPLRRGLARRFAIIGPEHNFGVSINGSPITPQERDLKGLLQSDNQGHRYLWEYRNAEIVPDSGWTVSGWIGALNRTETLEDGIQRGIVIMARGKLVQEPFVFDATVGQQYALSYLVGELYAEFVDEEEDTVSTTRNSLVWDTEANTAFKAWGQKEVNHIAREWAEKRSRDNEAALTANPAYIKFIEESGHIDNKRGQRIADRLIRAVVNNPLVDDDTVTSTIQLSLSFLEFDAFQELAQELTTVNVEDVSRLIRLFREWELVEAKEMMRVTQGRITTIERLETLIVDNALEVPVLHNFLKEFPWVLDPRWTLIADEMTYSKLLRDRFPDTDMPPDERRIDFLCVSESDNLIVVEIKRPHAVASIKELNQIEEYVSFMRHHIQQTTDQSLRKKGVTGYLLCGKLASGYQTTGKRDNLEKSGMYIRLYSDLLQMVKKNHREFLDRYEQLRKAKNRE